jgi:hypothetical protein
VKRVCPQCGQPIAWTAKPSGERPKCAPFCSDRCKLVDLSKWIGGDYVVSQSFGFPGIPRDPDE